MLFSFQSEFALAQIHLVSALTEVGLPLPTSYTSLALSLIWNGLSHLLFQVHVLISVLAFVTCTCIIITCMFISPILFNQ